MNWRRNRQLAVFLLPALFVCAADSAAQIRPGAEPADSSTNVIIRVRTVRGTPLLGFATVRLTARVGSFDQTASTREAGEAIFTNVQVGNYVAEVTSPGFLRAQEDVWVTMSGNGTTVIINLIPEPEPGVQPVPGGLPVLTPKAQQEIDKALEAMRANDLKEARKRLEKAQKMAPGHPDIYYLLGMLYLQMSEPQQAKASFEKAIALYPAHAKALAALGDMYMREGDYKSAIKALERSLEKDPDSWQTQGMLASSLYQEQIFERAKLHAARAIELARGKMPELQLLMGQILIGLGENDSARPYLETFVQLAPSHPNAAAARKFLEPKPVATAVRAGPGPSSSEAAPPAAPPKISVPPPEPPPRAWAPPDVDDQLPAVTQDVPCVVADVLERASRRARALVNSLERITATETIAHEVVGISGSVRESEKRDFNYVVTIRQYRKGTLSVEEDRWGRDSYYGFSSGIYANGLAAAALVFHPIFAPSFEMRCEGLGQWKGQPAWVVYFRRNSEVPNNFRRYTTDKGSFEVRFKGRAWISTNTGDVLRIQTDLMEPIEEAKLYRDHLVIEYAPVAFEKMKTQMWLPETAELFAELKGKRYHIKHTLRDFMLFSVDVDQQIEKKDMPDPAELLVKPPPPPPPL